MLNMKIYGEVNAKSIKDLYWKNGNIVKTLLNGTGIICNNICFCENGSFDIDSLDNNLEMCQKLSNGTMIVANTITEVYSVENSCPFNPYDLDEVKSNCHLVWKRMVKMTVGEIEKKLGLEFGSLQIVSDK